MATLTYIHHDCFLLETPECGIVFDFWKEPEAGDLLRRLKRISAGRPVYVFVSHHHKDHFTPEIFEWAAEIPSIHYIVSNDVRKLYKRYFSADSRYVGPRRVEPEMVTVAREGDILQFPGADFHIFGSTDIGNSVVVVSGRKRYFHAGDLNAWIWKDESTEQEIAEALAAFRKKVTPIAEQFPRIDVAMFPVDSRIGSDWWEGAREFVRMVDVGIFVPMHFELDDTLDKLLERHADAEAFKEYANPERGIYVSLQTHGESLAIADAD